jgi:hypothetical protein
LLGFSKSSVVVNLPEPPKESTLSSHDISSQDDVVTATATSKLISKNPSKVDSNVEDPMQSKSSISSPQTGQPSIMMSEGITDNNKIGGIGEYLPRLGYRLTNEYVPNSLKSTCSPKSVQAYCNSSDSCVDCDGNCIPSDSSIIKNGVTSTCSNGKWMRFEGIGEYLPGLGYRLTNEYMPNSLKSTCPPKSVQAYCDSSDSCVDCYGNCIPSGNSIIK